MTGQIKYTFLLLIFLISCSFAESTIGVNAGYLYTKGMDNGATLGIAYFRSVDEALEIGVGFDVYNRTYAKMTQVAVDDDLVTQVSTDETSVEYSRTLVPLMFSLRIRFPSRYYKFGYFARGTFAYNLLYSKETNYATDSSDTRTFSGLGWQLGGGIFYRVGSKSTLIFDGYYAGGEVSRDISNAKQSLPISQRVKTAGPGFRVSVEIDLR